MNLPALVLTGILAASSTNSVPLTTYNAMTKEAIKAQTIATRYRIRMEKCEEVTHISARNDALIDGAKEVAKDIKTDDNGGQVFDGMILGALLGGGGGLFIGAILGMWFGIQVGK